MGVASPGRDAFSLAAGNERPQLRVSRSECPTGAQSKGNEMRERLADGIRRVRFQQSIETRPCTHLASGAHASPQQGTCAFCDASGVKPVKLRSCLTCGSVGCCDSSPGRHARAHFEATGHPLIRSIELGESWAWCYPDQAYLPSSEVWA